MTEPLPQAGLMDDRNTGDAPKRAEMVRCSSLWSAYGDALGWISELTSAAGLRRRTAGAPLVRPIEWKHRIGGRSGAIVKLPQGCYSDDSQLRLATSRSIGPDGFDVEAFSRVELPVWLSYALGGGRSTSAAAANLARGRVSWFANAYPGWTQSGGNGAAMRIQPHVWASSDPADVSTFLPDVVRNSVCTHSHPNGLMGAVLSAASLSHTMATGRTPGPSDLIGAAGNIVPDVLQVIEEDFELSRYWRPAFERESGSFAEAWARAAEECQRALDVAAETRDLSGGERYEVVVDRLRLKEEARRGSGMLTAVAAVALTWCDPDPETALRIAANVLGTDTDTIATMAGAILGMQARHEPPVDVLDADLFRTEADRLARVGRGESPNGFQYPDLLRWQAPRARSDALVRLGEDDLCVLGLGRVESLGDPIRSSSPKFLWHWVKADFGQTLLIKRRASLKMGESAGDDGAARRMADQMWGTGGSMQATLDISGAGAEVTSNATSGHDPSGPEPERDIGAMIRYLESHRDEDAVVGQVIRRVVSRCSAAETAAFLAAAIDILRDSSNQRGQG